MTGFDDPRDAAPALSPAPGRSGAGTRPGGDPAFPLDASGASTKRAPGAVLSAAPPSGGHGSAASGAGDDFPPPGAVGRACDDAAAAAGLPALRGLTLGRLMLLALQRSAPVPGSVVNAWAAGDDAPLRAEALAHGPRILAEAAAAARRDAEAIAPHLAAARGGTLVDIGCGHGLVTAFLCRILRPARAILIDVESTGFRGHYWNEESSGYSELSVAAGLVAAEAVAPVPVNPLRDPLPQGEFHAALSTFSCGFHYPVDAYAAYLAEGVAPGGAVSLDLRKRRVRGSLDALAALSRIAPPVEIGRTRKMRRMLFRRPAAFGGD